jgi:hypothetical protein
MEQGYENPQIHTSNNVGPQIDNNIFTMVTKRKNIGKPNKLYNAKKNDAPTDMGS